VLLVQLHGYIQVLRHGLARASTRELQCQLVAAAIMQVVRHQAPTPPTQQHLLHNSSSKLQ
jgi:hypothetical protein